MALPTGAGCTCSPLRRMNTLGALPPLYSVRGAEQAGVPVVPVDRRTMGSPKSAVLRRMPEKPPIGAGVLERIGKTPLLRLERVGREFPSVGFYAKAEWLNPGGSVKDRPALSMIRDGERSGALRPGKNLPERPPGKTR